MHKISLLLAICLFSIFTITAQNSKVTEKTLYSINTKDIISERSLLKYKKVNTPTGLLSQIIDRMKAHNQALLSLKATLSMTQYDSVISIIDTAQGTINYVKGNPNNSLMRIDWAKPLQETLVLKNDKYLLYRERLKHAITGNISENKYPNELFSLITISKEAFLKDYNVQYLGNIKLCNNEVWQLKITPKKEKSYDSIKLWIDGDGMIIQVKLFEKNGDWKSISLSDLKKNSLIESSVFNIILPKGTKVIRSDKSTR